MDIKCCDAILTSKYVFFSLNICLLYLQGGYDAGFLYHCKFSEEQEQDVNQQQDEPFGFILVDDAEDDPICTITFR